MYRIYFLTGNDQDTIETTNAIGRFSRVRGIGKPTFTIEQEAV
jgi:hypothetical protein